MKIFPARPGYSEALDTLIAISPLVQQACFSIRLGGSSEGWGVFLLGYSGPAWTRMVKHLGLEKAPVKVFEHPDSIHYEISGHHGRTPIQLTRAEHKVTRVSGR